MNLTYLGYTLGKAEISLSKACATCRIKMKSNIENGYMKHSQAEVTKSYSYLFCLWSLNLLLLSVIKFLKAIFTS